MNTIDDEIMDLNNWHTEEITEELDILMITIPIPRKAIDKLHEYGYDFTTNLTNNLKEVYWQLCEAEKIQEKAKKPTTK